MGGRPLPQALNVSAVAVRCRQANKFDIGRAAQLVFRDGFIGEPTMSWTG
jgi:hypothetical protein